MIDTIRCPIEECDYDADDLDSLRSHTNARTDGNHRWEQVKQLLEDADDDGEPAEQPEAGDGGDTDDPAESDEASQKASENPDVDAEYAGQFETTDEESNDDEPEAGDGDDTDEPAESGGWSASTALILATVGLLIAVLVRGSDSDDLEEPESSDEDFGDLQGWSQ